MALIKCPLCGSSNTKVITGSSKVGSMLLSLFELVEVYLQCDE